LYFEQINKYKRARKDKNVVANRGEMREAFMSYLVSSAAAYSSAPSSTAAENLLQQHYLLDDNDDDDNGS
jgi:hypothetical protein